MLAIARKMLEDHDLCVLATCSNDLPNSSLMQYVYESSDMNIFMLTLEGSVKYNNIAANPQVSLLIDTRADLPQSGQPVKALTVYGRAGFVLDPLQRQDLVRQLAQKNENLADMASDSRCLVIQVHMEKMLLLDGVSDKSTIDIRD